MSDQDERIKKLEVQVEALIEILTMHHASIQGLQEAVFEEEQGEEPEQVN